jgi:hypothetical protein
VSDSFNPFKEWLKTPGGTRPEHYYALLGLAPFESDRELIAQAADKLRSRVRRIRPGDHMTEWQELLDEIGAARECLLDAEAKAAYDAELRGRGRRVAKPKTRASATPKASEAPLATPPGVKPKAAPRKPAVAEEPPVPPWLKKPAATEQAVGKSEPQEPPLPPWLQKRDAPTSAPPSSVPEPPPAPWLQAPPPPPQQAWEPEPPVPPAYIPPTRYSSVVDDEPSTLQRLLPPIVLGLFAIGALVGYIQFRKWQEQQEAAAYSESAVEVAAAPTEKPQPKPATEKPAATTQASPVAPQPDASMPAASAAPSPASVVQTSPPPTDQMSATPTPDPMPVPLAPAPTTSEQPKPPAQPVMAEAKPAPTEPAKPPLDPARQAELTGHLKAVRIAMGARNVAEAKRQLEQARAKIQTPEDEIAVTRYENLYSYLLEFWKGIVRRLAALKPMDELDLGKTRIIVVEASAEGLSFKSGGRVYRYRLENMPVPLLAGMVEGALNDAQSKVIFASFLALDPQGDVRRVQQLLDEATQGGEKVAELLPPVEEMTADRASVPEPTAGTSSGLSTAAAVMAVDGEQFRKRLADLRSKGQAAHDAADYREVAKEALGLAREAFDGQALPEAVEIAKFCTEMSHKGKNAAFARQATALQRRAEMVLKSKGK